MSKYQQVPAIEGSVSFGSYSVDGLQEKIYYYCSGVVGGTYFSSFT